jgi:hypothetical protein
MLYLLDASMLITANNLYYRLDSVPEFWEWLLYQAAANRVKMPLEIYEEIKEGPNGERDPLFAWLQSSDVRESLVLDELVKADLVGRALIDGYAPDLTDDEIEVIGRDPFLLAYAMVDPAHRTVVTSEVSASKKQRQNKKLPNVCESMGLLCCNPFELNRALNFTTDWRRRL